MAKPLSKNIRKTVQGGMKSVEKSIDNLLPGEAPPPAALAGAAIAGIAGVAGAAAAVRYLKQKRDRAATFHVRPNGEGWLLEMDGKGNPVDKFRTKRKAVQAARKAASEAAPSRLVIYTADGAEQTSHTYETV